MLVENEWKKLEKFDAAYFRCKNHLDGDGTQNYLVFQPTYKYFKNFTENYLIFISSWESKGLPNEKIGSTETSNYDQSRGLVYYNARINHGPIVNIYVVYRSIPGINNRDVTLEN